MLTLLSECHFWTIRDEIRIKDTDFGAFKYTRNRDFQSDDVVSLSKRNYTESRHGTVVLRNSRKNGGRLKDNIKKLDELLRSQKVIYAQWQDATVVLLLFSSGLIAYICVDTYTGDILRMVFEKYFVGKLAAEVITDAFFTRSHIVLAYNTNQLTVVNLQKPNVRPQGPEKISNMDPRICHVMIPGQGERKIARHLSVNSSFDLFVLWTKSSQNEVYPWRPTIRDQDRANIHVFKLKSWQLELISYCWTENDPLCVDFLRSTETQILTVEQKVSRKGEISAEICSYEINSGKMQRTSLSSIPMGTQISCYGFSPDQEKLFIGTIDHSICLHDLVQQSTKFGNQTDIIPTQCSWHPDSSLIMIGNDRAQFQCFDLALTPIGNQLQSEDVTPTNLLDISHYFASQPSLLKIAFNRKPDLGNFSQPYAQIDCLLLLLFENGPLGCLRFFAGAGMRGDIHNSGLTADVIIDKYLGLHQLEKAVNLLMALNWETYGAMCLISLHKIANYVFFRSDPKRMRIDLMIKAVKTFSDLLSEETKDEFSDQVFDLKRRFFFYLLRNKLYTSALEVAQDIEDYDLFMDIYNTTKSNKQLDEFSATSFRYAVAILHDEDHRNVNVGGYRSDSTYSQSTCSDTTQQIHEQQIHMQNIKAQNVLKNYIPPLPSLKSKILNAEMLKINIPKPELRISTINAERSRMPTVATRQIEMNSNNNVPLTGKTFASLTSKNNINQIRENLESNNMLAWKHMPDQTIGIPTITNASTNPYIPSTSHTIIPRASTSTISPSLSANFNNLSQNQETPYVFNPKSTSIITSSEISFSALSHSTASTYQPKFYQHPLVSRTIPPTSNSLLDTVQDFQKHLQKKPSASILSNGSSAQNGSLANLGHNSGFHSNSNKESNSKTTLGEKNKVKFSDTVQVAVVPEIPRKEKPLLQKRNGYSRSASRNITNPKKELADSLPLCHPHDDYLKDFNPIRTDVPRPSTRTVVKNDASSTNSKKHTPPPPPSIKVVHFGVV